MIPAPTAFPDPIPEHAHRLDGWWLLPPSPSGAPGTMAVVDRGEGLAVTAAALGLAPDVVDGIPAAPVDAVLLLGGRDEATRAAAERLNAGGALYWESRSPDRVEGDLAAAGLVPVGRWAVWPDPFRRRALVPLVPRAAIRWFAATHYPAWTPRKRLLAPWLGRPEIPTRWAARALGPWVAGVAVRPLAGRLPGHGRALAARVAARLAPATTAFAGATPVLLRHGAERLAILPFPAVADRPQVVIKAPRAASHADRGPEEQNRLRALRDRLGHDLRRAIPTPLGLVDVAGRAVAVESALAGSSLLRRAARSRSRGSAVADLERAVSWLGRLHAETIRLRRSWIAEDWEDSLAAPLRRLADRTGGRPSLSRLAVAVAEIRGSGHAPELPIAWRHRDFTPWNILRDGDDLAVIDWEGAGPGWAGPDVVHFATHWHEAARRAFDTAPRRRAFLDLWVAGADRLATAARSAVERHLEELGIARRWLPLLLLANRLEVADRTPGGPTGAALPDELAYLDVLAEGWPRIAERWR